MTRFKLGRRHPTFSVHNMKAALIVNNVLASFGPPPPASRDFMPEVTKAGGFKMFLNDTIGDCTAADCGNAMIWRSAAAGKPIVPTVADVLGVYEATSGYRPDDPNNPQSNASDQGADENTVSAYMVSNGIAGHKAEATAPIIAGAWDYGAFQRLKWAIIVFGGVRLGVNLPNSAEDQTNNNQPWSLSGDQTIAGGHDVFCISYDPTMFYVATWGQRQAVMPDWMEKFTEEGHAESWPIFVRSSGWTPTGFKDATMIRDLQALAVTA
jgi:hypothetical protein